MVVRCVLAASMVLLMWTAPRPGGVVLLGEESPQESPDRAFAYDRAAPLDVRNVATRTVDGATVHDLTYAAVNPRHGRIPAFLVKPRGRGPFAGVLYFHWLGQPRGDRTEFLDEALAGARDGVVSLLIQGYFPWTEAPADGATDRQQVIDQTIDARRAMDLLLSQPEVHGRRVAFVGHDYGAMYGAIIAGLERRARAYVLVAGMGTFSDWSLKYWPGTAAAGEAEYRRALAGVDPLHYIAVASPAALLFQFARRDIYITEAAATEFFDEARGPKEIRWYDAEHDLHIEAAAKDRQEWLARQLNRAVGVQ
jgi:dienelactone hydrolase